MDYTFLLSAALLIPLRFALQRQQQSLL